MQRANKVLRRRSERTCSSTYMPADDNEEEHNEDTVVAEHNAKAEAERAAMIADFEGKLFVPERAAEAKKYAGELYKKDRFDDAVSAYQRLLKFASDSPGESADLYTNIAAVRVKQWRWKEAIGACEVALAFQLGHAKAHYRKAQAHRGLKEFDVALTEVVKAREARKKANKSISSELMDLEKFIRRDLAKAEAEADEKRQAEARAAKRAEMTPEKVAARKEAERIANEERKAGLRQKAAEGRDGAGAVACAVGAGDGSGEVLTTSPGGVDAAIERSEDGLLLLPMGDKAEAGKSRDLTAWLRTDLLQHLKRKDARMMIYEEDGQIEVNKIPANDFDVDASVETSKRGERNLYFDVNLVAICRCTHFRHAEGALQFDFTCKVANVDNTTEAKPDQWVIDIELFDRGQKGLSRVDRLIAEFILPRYTPFLRGEVQECLRRLRRQAVQMLDKEASVAVDVD